LKTYKSKKRLKLHKLNHVIISLKNLYKKERLKKCPSCPVEFIGTKDFKKHLKIHIGKAIPYKCDNTSTESNSKQLMKHIII
jgi:hypothetical protein